MEFIRLATLARALREQGKLAGAKAKWQGAVNLGAGQREKLAHLARMAKSSGWQSEWEELLWTITNRFPKELLTIETLRQHDAQQRNTMGLHRVYAAICANDPTNALAKNDFVLLSLLLNLQTAKAQELAQKNFNSARTNAAFVSAYAYSLHLKGKTDEALKLFGSLKEGELDQPAVATYYGVVLAAAGKPAEAAKYLALADKATLLPEEKALVEKAKGGR